MTSYLNFCKSGILLVVLAVTGMFSACRKTFQEDKPKPVSIISGQVPTTITVEEMYARLPQTIMYNLADQVTLHLDKAQWRYEEEYLMARIPLNEEENRSYLYAVKPYNAPTGPVRAYLVQFFHNPGSTRDDFSGRQMWLNLQDYSIYGVEYAHNTPTRFMDPIPINPYWESELYDAGLFYLDGTNKIAVYSNPRNPDTSSTMLPWNSKHPGGRGKDLKCPDEGRSFFQNLLGGIGGVLLSLNEFLNNGEGGASPPWNQNGGDDGFYGGSDGYEPPQPPGGNNNWTPPPPPPINIWDNATTSNNNWSELGENPSTPIPIYVNGTILSNAVAGGTSVMTITNPTVTYLQSIMGLNQSKTNWLLQHLDKATTMQDFLLTYDPNMTQQEKIAAALKHLEMMIEYPGYLNFVNNFDIEYPTINVPLLNLADYEFTPGSANKPIQNITEYLKCFTNVAGGTYKVTLAVDQPQPGTRKAFKMLSGGDVCNVGHTFLILEQTIGGVTTKRSIGFYPSGTCTPLNPEAPGIINNDEEHDYNVSVSTTLSGTAFMNFISRVKNNVSLNNNYNLNFNNCTTWAHDMVTNSTEMENIPGTQSFWPLGHGMNPGDMGEDIRSMPLNANQAKSTSATMAPLNQGVCP